MAHKDVLGRAGEDRAARYLESRGYVVLDRNWRIREGEIDLVVARRGELVVVEVKTRRGEGYGHPFEAIDRRKQARVWRLAMAWIAAHPDQGHPVEEVEASLEHREADDQRTVTEQTQEGDAMAQGIDGFSHHDGA